jgi:lipoprotein-anchoring transpeptidase ErfK/SrfK
VSTEGRIGLPHASPAVFEAPVARNPHRSVRRLLLVTAATILAVVGGAYAASAMSQYATTAKPGVMIGSLSVDGYNARDLRQAVEEIAATAQIAISYENTTQSVTLAELGVTVNVSATVADALTADSGSSLLSDYTGWVKHSVALNLSVDEARLIDWAARRFTTGLPLPQDAAVRFDESSGAYVVSPARTGHIFDIAPLQRALQALAANPQVNPACSLRLTETRPQLEDGAALTAAQDANRRLRLSLRFSDGLGQTYKATAADIAQWTVITPQPNEGKFTVAHDPVVLAQSLGERLAEAFTVSPRDQRVLVDQAGQALRDIDAGQLGVTVGDLSRTVDAVGTALEKGLGVDLAVPINRTEPQIIESSLSSPAPTKGKWIDIDLSAQTTTLLEGDQIVASYVISSGKSDTPTPTGTYAVWLKVGSQTMTGTEVDGTPYSVPNVTWVTYFYKDYGFHTAYWLDESQIGAPQSHGCINMREAESHFIYDWAPTGTKVVVHD